MTESPWPGRLAWVITGVALLIGIFWLRLALSVHRNSTWDEDDHIYSGYTVVEARPGGLRDQVQSEFSDSAAADNLGDGGEEIHGVEGDALTIPPAFYLFVAMVAGMNIGLA